MKPQAPMELRIKNTFWNKIKVKLSYQQTLLDRSLRKPYDCLAYCLNRVSSLRCREKSWGDRAGSSGKPMWLEFSEQRTREERTAQRTENYSVPFEVSVGNWLNMSVGKLPETRKWTALWNKSKLFRGSYRVRRVAIPIIQSGKFHNLSSWG